MEGAPLKQRICRSRVIKGSGWMEPPYPAESRTGRIQGVVVDECVCMLDWLKAEARARELQAVERRKAEEKRASHDRHFWVDGIVGSGPTQLAYLAAQALANITAYFHPDLDNPPT